MSSLHPAIEYTYDTDLGCTDRSFEQAISGLAVRSGRSKDLEIIVLRHQLVCSAVRSTAQPWTTTTDEILDWTPSSYCTFATDVSYGNPMVTYSLEQTSATVTRIR